jgi:CheY-like chemotaxis protein
LEGAGHQIWEAADGAGCQRLAQGQRPDLVLCDPFLPGQEGVKAIRAIRSLGLDAPVVAMSGGGWGGDLVDFLSCAKLMGAVEALVKPIAPGRLLAVVERWALQRV